MVEEIIKKREWIKNAAIIFLTVLLILTFFSNTIMNISLPEVATEYVQSNTIDNKVRISGKVTSKESYDVVMEQTRKVDSVKVKVGDTVEEGDILFTLAQGDSDELEAAKETLHQLELAYKKAVLEAQRLSAETDNSSMLTMTEKELTKAKEDLTEARRKLSAITDNPTAKLIELENLIDKNQKWVDDYTEKLTEKKREQAGYALYMAEDDTAEYNYKECAREILDFTNNQAKYQELVDKYTEQKKEIKDLQSEIEKLDKSITDAEKANAKYNAAENRDKVNDSIDAQLAQLDLEEQEYQIEKARKNVAELSGNGSITEIKAKSAGIIDSIGVTAGHTANKDDVLCTIQVPDVGFTLTTTVSSSQARYLTVGDTADISSWYYSGNTTATLTRISVDPKDPQNSKLLTFDIDGDVSAGQSLSFSIGKKNASYELTVPNSAIRSDTNGTFVLMITAKNSPLGNRYYATRVNVEVLASDDKNTAINGSIDSWESVITTSTNNAPIKDQDQVRLRDSN